jgi:hypothetical protein
VPPFDLDIDTVDVRWEDGKYFEFIKQLTKLEKQ